MAATTFPSATKPGNRCGSRTPPPAARRLLPSRSSGSGTAGSGCRCRRRRSPLLPVAHGPERRVVGGRCRRRAPPAAPRGSGTGCRAAPPGSPPAPATSSSASRPQSVVLAETACLQPGTHRKLPKSLIDGSDPLFRPPRVGLQITAAKTEVGVEHVRQPAAGREATRRAARRGCGARCQRR